MFQVGRYLSVDGKDGADGYEAVDVGGAVERIKAHNIFALEGKKTAEIVLKGHTRQELVEMEEAASDSQIK